MKTTDYVAKFIKEEGVNHVFGVTGGAVVHLFDSIANTPGIMPVFTHHEQAASLAAEAYSRVTNNMGACCVTTGPGGTNAITGLCAAWLDSIPCIFISGQTRIEHTTQDKPIRQLGSQQINIISIVKSITKYAVMVDDINKIKYYLQKAVYYAKHGRPGPVWVDIPLNFQWQSIDPEKLPSFVPPVESGNKHSKVRIGKKIKKCVALLLSAKRPIIIAGYGIRLSHAENEFIKLVETLRVPFVSSWNASDYLKTDDNLYIGRTGISGQRGANLAVQNSDLVIAIGSHLSIPITGSNYSAFARDAKKVVVDIDDIELKNHSFPIDVPINCDAKYFIQQILRHIRGKINIDWWTAKCRAYKSYNMISVKWKKQRKGVNPYTFIDMLSQELEPTDVIAVDGGGTVLFMSFQALRIKEGQRLIVSAGIGAMGAGLPESVGACFANERKRTVCMTGDGSLQFNIHELQTIVHHDLPVKIFVFNNEGYLAIRHTQNGFLDHRYVGSDKKGGISMPDYQKISRAYGIRSIRISGQKNMRDKIRSILRAKGPALCEIMVSRGQQLIPRMEFKHNPNGTNSPMPLEDMAPFMNRKEFINNMIVKPLPESIR